MFDDRDRCYEELKATKALSNSKDTFINKLNTVIINQNKLDSANLIIINRQDKLQKTTEQKFDDINSNWERYSQNLKKNSGKRIGIPVAVVIFTEILLHVTFHVLK